jgi:hypothetical protein
MSAAERRAEYSPRSRVNNRLGFPTLCGQTARVRPIARADEEIAMLDHDGRVGRPERRRVRGPDRERASTRERRMPIATGARNACLSIVDEHADRSRELLMERLDATFDGRFVPEIV